MKILFCHKDIGTPNLGGVSTLYKNLALGLKNLGHNIFIITSRNSENIGKNINRIIVPYFDNKIKYSKALVKEVYKIKPDIAECSNWGFELLYFLKKRKSKDCKTKVIIRCDPSAETLFGNDGIVFSNYEKEILDLADFRIAVSDFSKKDNEKRYNKVIEEVILNGVDLNKFNIIENNSRDGVIWIGKETEMKGFDLLEKTIKENRDIKFKLVMGKSPKNTNSTIFKYSNVEVFNNLTDEELIFLLNTSKILLSTSRWEGFGLIFLEAMACGLKILAPDSLEVAHEFVHDKRFFYNNIESLKNILHSDYFDSNIEKYCRNIASDFSWQKNIDRTVDIYNSLL